MIKKALRKKTDELVTALAGAAVLVGSYLVMAAANAILAKRDK